MPFVAVTGLAGFLVTWVIHTPRIDLKPALARVSLSLLIKPPTGKLLGLRASHAQQALAELPVCLHKSREFILYLALPAMHPREFPLEILSQFVLLR